MTSLNFSNGVVGKLQPHISIQILNNESLEDRSCIKNWLRMFKRYNIHCIFNWILNYLNHPGMYYKIMKLSWIQRHRRNGKLLRQIITVCNLHCMKVFVISVIFNGKKNLRKKIKNISTLNFVVVDFFFKM